MLDDRAMSHRIDHIHKRELRFVHNNHLTDLQATSYRWKPDWIELELQLQAVQNTHTAGWVSNPGGTQHMHLRGGKLNISEHEYFKE